MKLSKEQTDIANFCKDRLGNLLCLSSPGSGKSTTLLRAAIPNLPISPAQMLILMFSKAAQLEFAAKAKQLGIKAQISTFHSTGRGMLVSSFKSDYDQEKLKKIGQKIGVRKYEIYRLVSLAKTEGLNLVSSLQGISGLNQICDSYNLELSQGEVNQAKQVFDTSNRDTKTFDYDDMIYAPVLHGLNVYGYKAVLVDEFQDISGLRFEFLKRCCNKDHARFIMVGDPNQSIFGWNGADSGITEKLKTLFKAETLPLSISWRCSKAVTRECNKIFPGMVPRPDAPEGSVQSITADDFEFEDFSIDCFILCRVNAPLVKLAFSLLTRGYKCRIQGKEIGNELVSYCKKWKWEELHELSSKLDIYLKKQQQKLLPDNRKQYKAIEDKFDTIKLMIEKCIKIKRTTKEELFQFINHMFSDEGDGIVLSTPYKVKGLERKDVYIYGNDVFFPPPWIESPSDLAEERRVKYVAMSRAKENLYFVNIGKGKKEEKSYSFKLPKKGPGTNKADSVLIPANSDDLSF